MIIDSYKDFTDSVGLIHCEPPVGGISQNGVRFTSEAIYALKFHKELTPELRDSFIKALRTCEKEPGLLRRHPLSDEGDGPDNQYAMLAVSKELGTSFAKDWIKYGRKAEIIGYNEEYDRKRWYSKFLMYFCKLSGYKYIFNNNNPGYFSESAWMGRQLPLVAHAMVYTNEKLGIFWTLAWCIGVILSARNKNSTDGKILAFFMIKASEDRRSWLMKITARYWSKKLREHFVGGIGGVLKSYFRNKDQPSIKWLWNEYAE